MRDYRFKGFHPDQNGKTVIKLNGKEIRGDWKYGDLHSDGPFIDEHYVLPETAGQFTGLTDKKGKEIFEGDIANINGALGDSSQNGVVEYCEAEYIIKLKRIDDNFDCWARLNDWISKLEVIGNIFENPELLGVGIE